jgi:hypothetical protein
MVEERGRGRGGRRGRRPGQLPAGPEISPFSRQAAQGNLDVSRALGAQANFA